AMDGNALLPPPTLLLPNPDQQKNLDEFTTTQTPLEKTLKEAVAKMDYTDPATLTNAPKLAPKEIVWVEDDFPPKATVKVNKGNAPAKWVTAAEGPVFSGKRALQRTGQGLHQVLFTEAKQPLTVGAGDKFFAYVYLDPTNTPK